MSTAALASCLASASARSVSAWAVAMRCYAERRLLRLRQGLDPGEDRSEQLVEAGERQVCLGPDAGRPEDPHPGVASQPDGPFDECRFADPGVAADQQRPAALVRPADEAADDPQLPVPTEDPFARDHRRRIMRQPTSSTGPSFMAA